MVIQILDDLDVSGILHIYLKKHSILGFLVKQCMNNCYTEW